MSEYVPDGVQGTQEYEDYVNHPVLMRASDDDLADIVREGGPTALVEATRREIKRRADDREVGEKILSDVRPATPEEAEELVRAGLLNREDFVVEDGCVIQDSGEL